MVIFISACWGQVGSGKFMISNYHSIVFYVYLLCLFKSCDHFVQNLFYKKAGPG